MLNLKKHLVTLIDTQGFKRYFSNTSWMIAEKIIRMFVALMVGVYVARYLGPEKFGILSYSVSLVALFSVIANLGLEQIVIKKLVQNPEKRDILLGSAFFLKLLGSFGFILIILVSLLMTNNEPITQAIIIIISCGFLFQSFNVIDYYFQSQVKAKFTVIAQLTGFLSVSLIKIALVLTHSNLIFFAIAISIENVFIGFFLIALYKRNELLIKKWAFKKKITIEILSESWPLLFSSLVVMIYMRIDQVMLKHMVDNSAVGNYAVAVRLSEVLFLIPVTISNSFFPAIISSKKISEELYFQRLSYLFSLMTWLSIFLAAVVSFYATEIVSTIFGNQFIEAGKVLSIYVWASIFVFIGTVSGKWFVMENLQNLMLFYTTLCALINILLNYLLIIQYSLIGAAYATIISYGISVIVFPLLNSRSRTITVLVSRSFNIKRLFNV